jgi:hypothetical protein
MKVMPTLNTDPMFVQNALGASADRFIAVWKEALCGNQDALPDDKMFVFQGDNECFFLVCCEDVNQVKVSELSIGLAASIMAFKEVLGDRRTEWDFLSLLFNYAAGHDGLEISKSFLTSLMVG